MVKGSPHGAHFRNHRQNLDPPFKMMITLPNDDTVYPVPERSPELTRRISAHESGHALLARCLGSNVHLVTIVPGDGFADAFDQGRRQLSTSMMIVIRKHKPPAKSRYAILELKPETQQNPPLGTRLIE